MAGECRFDDVREGARVRSGEESRDSRLATTTGDWAHSRRGHRQKETMGLRLLSIHILEFFDFICFSVFAFSSLLYYYVFCQGKRHKEEAGALSLLLRINCFFVFKFKTLWRRRIFRRSHSLHTYPIVFLSLQISYLFILH